MDQFGPKGQRNRGANMIRFTLLVLMIVLTSFSSVNAARVEQFPAGIKTPSAVITDAAIVTGTIGTLNSTTFGATSGYIEALRVKELSSQLQTGATYSKIKGAWYVSISNEITSHSDDTQTGSLADYIDKIGSDDALVVLPSKSEEYTFNNPASYSIPTNITIKVNPGAVFKPALNCVLTFTASSNLIAGSYQIFDVVGAGTFGFADGMSLRLSWFSGLADALLAIGSSKVGLIVDKSISMASDKTIPSNIDLIWESPGNVITVNTGHVLTLNCSIKAGRHKILQSDVVTGTIVGAPLAAVPVPEWFELGSDSTDKAPNISACLRLFDLSVLNGNSVYSIKTPIQVRAYDVIEGNGAILEGDSGLSDYLVKIEGSGYVLDSEEYDWDDEPIYPANEVYIRNFTVKTNGALGGIYIKAGYQIGLSGISILNTPRETPPSEFKGLSIENSFDLSFNQVLIHGGKGANSYGLYVVSNTDNEGFPVINNLYFESCTFSKCLYNSYFDMDQATVKPAVVSNAMTFKNCAWMDANGEFFGRAITFNSGSFYNLHFEGCKSERQLSIFWFKEEVVSYSLDINGFWTTNAGTIFNFNDKQTDENPSNYVNIRGFRYVSTALVETITNAPANFYVFLNNDAIVYNYDKIQSYDVADVYTGIWDGTGVGKYYNAFKVIDTITDTTNIPISSDNKIYFTDFSSLSTANLHDIQFDGVSLTFNIPVGTGAGGRLNLKPSATDKFIGRIAESFYVTTTISTTDTAMSNASISTTAGNMLRSEAADGCSIRLISKDPNIWFVEDTNCEWTEIAP